MIAPSRLFLDCTHTYLRPETATGIQRVVRQVAARSGSCSPAGHSCTPVYHYLGGWHRASDTGAGHAMAQLRLRRQALRSRRKQAAGRSRRRLAAMCEIAAWRLAEAAVSACIFLLKSAHALGRESVRPVAGDTLLLMEYPDVARRKSVVRAKAAGVRVVAVVYDLIPLGFPGYFVDPAPWIEWFDWISRHADRVITISKAVEREFADAYPHAAHKLGYFHLGADFSPPPGTSGLPPGCGYFLMVGTIEPRKGHHLVLGAFEKLWAAGRDVSLVIVGRPGWHNERLVARIRRHPENGRRLVWLDDADDARLEAAYRGAHALIAASEAEGFGLPLVEALVRGVPVIASDIPVFREVAGDWADYFEMGNLDSLAERAAFSASRPRRDVSGFRWIGWEESARRALLLAAGP